MNPRDHEDYHAPSDSLYGECCECGRKLIWGGMSWWPHSEEYHAGVRRQLLRAVATIAKRAQYHFAHEIRFDGVDLEVMARPASMQAYEQLERGSLRIEAYFW